MKYVFQHFWSWYDVLSTVQLSYKNSLSFNELLSFPTSFKQRLWLQ